MQMDYGVLPQAGGEPTYSSSNMAPFLTKLFQIVSAGSTDHCIQWTPKGDSFVISDPDTFARDILPTYFKHNNIRSFIRQLNTYGFRKRTNISSTDEHLEFFHTKFRRDDPQGLTQIKRCHQPKASSGGGGGGRGGGTALVHMPEEVHASMETQRYNPDLDTIRSRVTELKTRLGSLQVRDRLPDAGEKSAGLPRCSWLFFAARGPRLTPPGRAATPLFLEHPPIRNLAPHRFLPLPRLPSSASAFAYL